MYEYIDRLDRERERTGFENEWRGGGINGECCGEEEIQE